MCDGQRTLFSFIFHLKDMYTFSPYTQKDPLLKHVKQVPAATFITIQLIKLHTLLFFLPPYDSKRDVVLCGVNKTPSRNTLYRSSVYFVLLLSIVLSC